MAALKPIADSPSAFVVEEFASAEECLHIERRGGHWEYIEALEIETTHDRTGFSWELPIEGDAKLEALRDRIEDRVGLCNDRGDTLRFRRYSPGEWHPPHLDCYESDGLLLVATAMLCVRAPDEGGETLFPHADPQALVLEPRRGHLGLWFNYRASGEPDRGALHQAERVLSGSKVTVTYFIYKEPTYAGWRPMSR